MCARLYTKHKYINLQSIAFSEIDAILLQEWAGLIIHHQFSGFLSVGERSLLMEAEVAVRHVMATVDPRSQKQASREAASLLTRLSNDGWVFFWQAHDKALTILIKKNHYSPVPPTFAVLLKDGAEQGNEGSAVMRRKRPKKNRIKSMSYVESVLLCAHSLSPRRPRANCAPIF